MEVDIKILEKEIQSARNKITKKDADYNTAGYCDHHKKSPFFKANIVDKKFNIKTMEVESYSKFVNNYTMIKYDSKTNMIKETYELFLSDVGKITNIPFKFKQFLQSYATIIEENRMCCDIGYSKDENGTITDYYCAIRSNFLKDPGMFIPLVSLSHIVSFVKRYCVNNDEWFDMNILYPLGIVEWFEKNGIEYKDTIFASEDIRNAPFFGVSNKSLDAFYYMYV